MKFHVNTNSKFNQLLSDVSKLYGDLNGNVAVTVNGITSPKHINEAIENYVTSYHGTNLHMLHQIITLLNALSTDFIDNNVNVSAELDEVVDLIKALESIKTYLETLKR